MSKFVNPTLPALFTQLGLDSDAASIDRFIEQHRGALKASVCEAPFWNHSQAQFLREAIQADAEWAPAVDDLVLRLTP